MTSRLRVQITRRDGSTSEVEAGIGRSLLEMLRDAGIDEIAALCGRNCSCATCHVYIEAPGSLPEPNIEESEMLDTLVHQTSLSRLACQLVVGDGMGLLQVEVAPEE